MQFDIDDMALADRHELLLVTIVPRPIALNYARAGWSGQRGQSVAMVCVVAHPEARSPDHVLGEPLILGLARDDDCGNAGNHYEVKP
jgi:hypothetical protein